MTPTTTTAAATSLLFRPKEMSASSAAASSPPHHPFVNVWVACVSIDSASSACGYISKRANVSHDIVRVCVYTYMRHCRKGVLCVTIFSGLHERDG